MENAFKTISAASALYKRGGKYYRLIAVGQTPNRCWLVAPVLRELLDINVATAVDVYGEEVVELAEGTVPSAMHFFTTNQ